MFSLKQIREKVFHLQFDSSRELSMAFFRYTEFYESRYDHIRENRFTLVQQMGAYCREYLEDNNADWSYTSDWGGFNIPVDVIKAVHNLGIPDPNHYDHFMISIYEMIMCETMHQKAYLIGTSGDSGLGLLRHEMTHAMFYVDDDYRKTVTDIITGTSQKLQKELIEALKKQNYPEKVAIDEINAYITTGTAGYFDDIDESLDEEFNQLTIALKSLHKKNFKSFFKQT